MATHCPQRDRFPKVGGLAAVLLVLARAGAKADTGVNEATQNQQAFAKYGLTGAQVVVAILDRGLDYTHPDFCNADGTTRIRMMWDMSNANPDLGLCDPGQPEPVVYTEAQINQALQSGTPLGERDAVGHGTVTTGLAASNGRAALPASAQWAGIAPEADLVIVKMVSEGAPAHSGQPAENGFQGCMNKALDLPSQEAATLGEPIVALMDSGTQWGPIDGTSAISARITADFSGPGQVYVAASGDEGTLPNHARATYSKAKPAVFPFNRSGNTPVYFQLWSTGRVPADVTLTMSDAATSVTAAPNSCESSADGSITLCNYLLGQQFYPWTSSSGDDAVWFNITGHSGAGSITVQATGTGTGTADAYGDAKRADPDDRLHQPTDRRQADRLFLHAGRDRGWLLQRPHQLDRHQRHQAIAHLRGIDRAALAVFLGRPDARRALAGRCHLWRHRHHDAGQQCLRGVQPDQLLGRPEPVPVQSCV